MQNPVIKYGAPLFALFFIYTATGDASAVGADFGAASIDLISRVLQFLSAVLDGANSAS